MQTTKSPGTAKSDYFRRQAETARAQLNNAEADLVRYREQARGFTDRGRPVDPELAGRLEHTERKVRELKRKVQNSLYIAGRP